MAESGNEKTKPHFLRVGLRLNTFYREESMGRGFYWLSFQAFRCLIKMEIYLEITGHIPVEGFGALPLCDR